VITDYADNLQRIARIIAVMDVANATDVEIIRLKHAIATDLAPLVLRLIESGSTAPAAGQGQADTSFKTTLVAEPRSNALILRAANPARMALVKSLIERLDQPDGGAGGPGLGQRQHSRRLPEERRRGQARGDLARGSQRRGPFRANFRCCTDRRRCNAWRHQLQYERQPVFHRWADPGRRGDQFAHHYGTRAPVPTAARGDRQA
jgi:type II secretory pathway component GspD/PulD (secretin)